MSTTTEQTVTLADATEAAHVERIHADHAVVKRLGNWTRAGRVEVRVQRGGVAILTAMCSREYLRDLRLAHRTGGHPTVDDPARIAC